MKTDLANLPIGNCYTRVLVDGQPTQPFSMKIDWDSITKTPRDKGVANRIREESRMKFGVPIQEVEAQINSRIGFNEPEPDKTENPFKPASKLPF